MTCKTDTVGSRPNVTLRASKLRAMGAIEDRRGKITAVDRTVLEAATCECYDIVTSEFEHVMHAPLRRPALQPHTLVAG